MDNKEYLEKIGKNIIDLRVGKGLKQIDLAVKIGIEDSALRRIEKGRVNSTILMLKKVANALEIDVCELIKYK